jgi:small subunit ribosomal protein S13
MSIDVSRLYSSQKSIKKTLTEFFGIGDRLAEKICKQFGISSSVNMSILSKIKTAEIKLFLEKELILDSKLKFIEEESKRRLIANNSVRGVRLVRGLPTRGQRTKSNGRTQKKRPLKHFKSN